MFAHTTVLQKETVMSVLTDPDGIYVDMTLGGGGHSAYLAQHLTAQGRIIGLDRDATALEAARERLAGASCTVDCVQSNYADLPQVLTQLGVPSVDGVMFDLGVSSYQLDTADRGFSYQHDGRLDMRMDQRQTLSAYEVVNTYSETRLAQVIRRYGEERWAKRIVGYIVNARQAHAIETTAELVAIIKDAIPAGARRQGPHPAKRTFQALRIEVNGELDDLERSIRQAVDALHTGGRIAVISFHSLEDRIVKQVFRELATGCICPPTFPVCTCCHKPTLRMLGKVRKAGAEELAQNPRARSAMLRVAEKVM